MAEQVRFYLCFYFKFLYHLISNIILYFRLPQDWTMWWGGGSGVVYGWGHNHRGQLGGVQSAKVKLPTVCDALSSLRPARLLGGEQTLLAVTHDGKLYATG